MCLPYGQSHRNRMNLSTSHRLRYISSKEGALKGRSERGYHLANSGGASSQHALGYLGKPPLEASIGGKGPQNDP